MKGLLRVRTKGSFFPSAAASVVFVISYPFLFPHACARALENGGTLDETTMQAARFICYQWQPDLSP